jgi:hypothetical protein
MRSSLSISLLVPCLPLLAALGGCSISADQAHDGFGGAGAWCASGGAGHPASVFPDRGGAGGHGPRPDEDAAFTCPGPTIDRWKELLVVDSSVVLDLRASNDDDEGTWSFRRRLEDLAGSPELAADLAYTWLSEWKAVTSVSVAPGLPDAPRVAISPRPGVDEVLLCPWLQHDPENGCGAACAACTDRRLDLAHAPFRLIAIVNRIDLGPATSCGREGGELRFVYNAVDPDSGAAIPFTTIFEYKVTLPATEDRRSWARAWRALGRVPFGPEYNARLAAVVALGLRGATLNRVLTNEVALGQAEGLPWEMRQFVPAVQARGGATLEETAVAHTPRLSLDGTDDLRNWLIDNRRAILAGDNLLRPEMLAASALLPSADFSWRAPGTDPTVLAAFNRNTCNGCHGGRGQPGDLPFRHLAAPESEGPYETAAASVGVRISRFLDNPGHDDELGRRAALLETAACGMCQEYPVQAEP